MVRAVERTSQTSFEAGIREGLPAAAEYGPR
jgi:hypothetical protein